MHALPLLLFHFLAIQLLPLVIIIIIIIMIIIKSSLLLQYYILRLPSEVKVNYFWATPSKVVDSQGK